jgi:hypothetical protein
MTLLVHIFLWIGKKSLNVLLDLYLKNMFFAVLLVVNRNFVAFFTKLRRNAMASFRMQRKYEEKEWLFYVIKVNVAKC